MGEAEMHQWTENDFEEMSWHDNVVHAIRIIKGEHGTGRFILDIDYILEWLKDESGSIAFRIAPATLEFREVTNLKIALDYETPTAGLTPFSLDRIDRRHERRDRYSAVVWNLVVNWPDGSISLEAKGFTQHLRRPPVISSEQWLSSESRGDGGFSPIEEPRGYSVNR